MRKPLQVSIFELWPIVKQFQWRLLAGIALIAMTTGFDLLGPLLIGKIADSVVTQPIRYSEFKGLCFLFLGAICFKAISEMLQAHTIQVTGLLITQELRLRVFEKIIRCPLKFFDEHSSGRLLTRVINDVRSLSDLFTASMSVLILDVMVIGGTIIAMLLLNWRLALAILITFPGVIFSVLYFGKKLSAAYQKARSKLSRINSFLSENVSAMAAIHRQNAQSERKQKFEAIVNDHQSALMDSIHAYAQVQPWANTLNGVSMATLLALGGFWVIKGEVTLGVVVAFLAYIRNLFQPVRDLVEKYNVVLSAGVSAERLADVLKEKSEELNASTDLRSQIQTPGIPCGIKFKEVNFGYDPSGPLVLENVSFEVLPGKSLAIIGATGSGKSTLVKLLLRFYDPLTGFISIGEESIEKWPLSQLRTHISYLPQEVYLFEGTLRENLQLKNTTLEDAWLIEKCQQTCLWDLVEKRGGLDFYIQEGGQNLSLGEKQLVSFARTLILNPEVLVLDEATASLDNTSESKLMQAVRVLMEGRTSLVIAHRLSTIENCDQVIVLEKGRIKEQGSPLELKNQNGIFSRFYQLYQETAL